MDERSANGSSSPNLLVKGAGATPPTSKNQRDGVIRRQQHKKGNSKGEETKKDQIVVKESSKKKKKSESKTPTLATRERSSSQLSDESGAERASRGGRSESVSSSGGEESSGKGAKGKGTTAGGREVVEQRTPRTPRTPRGNGGNGGNGGGASNEKDSKGGGGGGSKRHTPTTPRTPRGGGSAAVGKPGSTSSSPTVSPSIPSKLLAVELERLVRSDPIESGNVSYGDDYEDEEDDGEVVRGGSCRNTRALGGSAAGMPLSAGGRTRRSTQPPPPRSSSNNEIRMEENQHEGGDTPPRTPRGGTLRTPRSRDREKREIDEQLKRGEREATKRRGLGGSGGAAGNGIQEMLKEVREYVVATDCVTEGIMRCVKQVDADWMAVELVNIFNVEKKAVKIRTLAISIAADVFKHDPKDFLRSSSVYITILSEYTRLIGHRYLMAVIKPHVRLLTDVSMDLEIDPQRLKSDDDQQKNLQRLLAAARTLLHQIFQSARQIPFFLKQTIVSLSNLLVGVDELQIIGTLLFLRFICPALVTPEQYHILADPPLKGRRNLILVAKLLQLVANNRAEWTEQETKESYLQMCEPFVRESIPKFEEFAKQILDESLESDLNQHKLTLKSSIQGLEALKWMQTSRETMCNYLLECHGQEQHNAFEEFLQKYPPVTDDKDSVWNVQPPAEEKNWKKVRKALDQRRRRKKPDKAQTLTGKPKKNTYRKSTELSVPPEKNKWKRLSQGLSIGFLAQATLDDPVDVEMITLPEDKRDWADSRFFSHSSSDLKKKSNIVKKNNRRRLSLNEDLARKLNEVDPDDNGGSIGKHSLRSFFSRPIGRVNRLSKTFYSKGEGTSALDDLLKAEAEKDAAGFYSNSSSSVSTRKSRPNSEESDFSAKSENSTPPTPRKREDKIMKADERSPSPRKSLSNRFLMMRKSKDDKIGEDPESPKEKAAEEKKAKKKQKEEKEREKREEKEREKERKKEKRKEKANASLSARKKKYSSDEAEATDGDNSDEEPKETKAKKVKEKKGKHRVKALESEDNADTDTDGDDKLRRETSGEKGKKEKAADKEEDESDTDEKDMISHQEESIQRKRWSWGRSKKKELDRIDTGSADEGEGTDDEDKNSRKTERTRKGKKDREKERKGSRIFRFHQNDNKINNHDGEGKNKKKGKN